MIGIYPPTIRLVSRHIERMILVLFTSLCDPQIIRKNQNKLVRPLTKLIKNYRNLFPEYGIAFGWKDKAHSASDVLLPFLPTISNPDELTVSEAYSLRDTSLHLKHLCQLFEYRLTRELLNTFTLYMENKQQENHQASCGNVSFSLAHGMSLDCFFLSNHVPDNEFELGTVAILWPYSKKDQFWSVFLGTVIMRTKSVVRIAFDPVPSPHRLSFLFDIATKSSAVTIMSWGRPFRDVINRVTFLQEISEHPQKWTSSRLRKYTQSKSGAQKSAEQIIQWKSLLNMWIQNDESLDLNLVTVHGIPGSGKSALANRLIKEAEEKVPDLKLCLVFTNDSQMDSFLLRQDKFTGLRFGDEAPKLAIPEQWLPQTFLDKTALEVEAEFVHPRKIMRSINDHIDIVWETMEPQQVSLGPFHHFENVIGENFRKPKISHLNFETQSATHFKGRYWYMEPDQDPALEFLKRPPLVTDKYDKYLTLSWSTKVESMVLEIGTLLIDLHIKERVMQRWNEHISNLVSIQQNWKLKQDQAMSDLIRRTRCIAITKYSLIHYKSAIVSAGFTHIIVQNAEDISPFAYGLTMTPECRCCVLIGDVASPVDLEKDDIDCDFKAFYLLSSISPNLRLMRKIRLIQGMSEIFREVFPEISKYIEFEIDPSIQEPPVQLVYYTPQFKEYDLVVSIAAHVMHNWRLSSHIVIVTESTKRRNALKELLDEKDELSSIRVAMWQELADEKSDCVIVFLGLQLYSSSTADLMLYQLFTCESRAIIFLSLKWPKSSKLSRPWKCLSQTLKKRSLITEGGLISLNGEIYFMGVTEGPLLK
eukprot:Gregarina_sp_Poly_1__2076@NODE_1548_length_3867_cov_26_745789_g1022_i0_p1_GENE_NODE_1548_length_3867_cov_26_745789_g1022_i0NODE_1548_length_3867_cov_26_745789_g1022_i0_p1_ORF_typecomplete_len911_score113_50AAA_11/PF13086_6/2_8e08AAA_22/PF13401_6/0_00037AAA_22/PF13401_6/5_1e02AAA_16/PF13191_6/0_00021AAA_16/PF13191_6/1_1e03NACHT/PF05729_12/0_0012NACHT/PF05729_12/1_5e02AAA_19/PF13245_6/0_0067AAA_19/PF13245_6/1_4e03NBARC/PF00931_22/0_0031PRK/PF00485_18/0_0091PRK/PF00485_18/3_8e03KTI12/PF08433_10/0_0